MNNLKQISEKVKKDIDPNGGPGSILAKNHQNILLQFLKNSGRYVGASFTAKLNQNVSSQGKLSFEGGGFDSNLSIRISTKCADGMNFNARLERVNIGDLMIIKDFVGRVGYFEVLGIDTSEQIKIDLKADNNNTKYTYQSNEEEDCVVSFVSSGGGSATNIIDNLTSTDVDSSLSANQGSVLYSYIKRLNEIVTSDDTNLDELQEIVDFIKQNKKDLENLSVSNIAGLQRILDTKITKNENGSNIKVWNEKGELLELGYGLTVVSNQIRLDSRLLNDRNFLNGSDRFIQTKLSNGFYEHIYLGISEDDLKELQGNFITLSYDYEKTPDYNCGNGVCGFWAEVRYKDGTKQLLKDDRFLTTRATELKGRVSVTYKLEDKEILGFYGFDDGEDMFNFGIHAIGDFTSNTNLERKGQIKIGRPALHIGKRDLSWDISVKDAKNEKNIITDNDKTYTYDDILNGMPQNNRQNLCVNNNDIGIRLTKPENNIDFFNCEYVKLGNGNVRFYYDSVNFNVVISGGNTINGNTWSRAVINKIGKNLYINIENK